MQLTRSPLFLSLFFIFVVGCGVTTQLPLKSEDIRLCGGAASIINAVQRISTAEKLSFHYGSHLAEFGTQVTFRLIGKGFEIELFNTTADPDYTLRVYQMQSNAATKELASRAYMRFKTALISDKVIYCGS